MNNKLEILEWNILQHQFYYLELYNAYTKEWLARLKSLVKKFLREKDVKNLEKIHEHLDNIIYLKKKNWEATH